MNATTNNKHRTSKEESLTHKAFGAEERFTLKGVRASTRRLPAAARRRAEIHRGRADRQEQRCNHPKEPPKTLELSYGKHAIVDAADYEQLSKYRWCALEKGRSWYAKTLNRNGTILSMHRLILNAPKGLFVDHINHNGLDNRKKNLRLCTHLENLRNARPRKGGSSKYKGVCWEKAKKRFRAKIQHNRKGIHLGYFKNEIEAAKAYDRKAVELFGEFAYLNFPQEVFSK